MATLNSLMTGGYELDNETDLASDFELYIEDIERKAENMTLNQLYTERFDAMLRDDHWAAEIYDKEIDSRNPAIEIPIYSQSADEPWYQDNLDHEDRRKEKLENYGPVESELPF